MTLFKLTRNKISLLAAIAFFLFFAAVPQVKALNVPGGGTTTGTPNDAEYKSKIDTIMEKSATKNSYQYSVWEPAVYGTSEMNQQSFTNETFKSLIASMNDKILGCLNCPAEQKEYGAIQSLGKTMASLYTIPPASAGEYFADLGKHLGITPAYAQATGTGFEGLRPFLSIWKSFRNLAYFFFVIIFVFIGFAMMFRMKINPQTVITIQNTIPRAVVALILVTFSYAIAGLLIDLIVNVVSAIGVSVVNPKSAIDSILGGLNGLLSDNHYPTVSLDNPNILTFATLFFGRGMEYAVTIAGQLNPVVLFLSSLGTSLSPEVVRVINSFPPFSLGQGLLVLIFAIILLITFIRLFFMLLSAYARVLLSVLLGPLQIMIGVLPGQNTFGKWIKNLVANLAVFPAVIIMLALSATVYTAATDNGNTGLWVPSTLRPPASNTVGVNVEFVGALVAFGIILLTPKVADAIKAFMEGKSFDHEGGIKEAFNPIIAPIAGAVGFASGSARSMGQALVSQKIGPHIGLREGPKEVIIVGQKDTPTNLRPGQAPKSTS